MAFSSESWDILTLESTSFIFSLLKWFVCYQTPFVGILYLLFILYIRADNFPWSLWSSIDLASRQQFLPLCLSHLLLNCLELVLQAPLPSLAYPSLGQLLRLTIYLFSSFFREDGELFQRPCQPFPGATYWSIQYR